MTKKEKTMEEQLNEDIAAEKAAQEAEVEEHESKQNKKRWYIVHTYSGYENKVKADLEKTIENRHIQDQILEVTVPLNDVVEIKNGVKKTVQKKMFPGYVLIHMVMNDDTWYVVRNTRGVTGFVGPGSKPVPLEEGEVEKMSQSMPGAVIGFETGDMVTVVSGVWEGTIGKIRSINESKQCVTINVDMFGRETPVDIPFEDIHKM
jgi:transcriptional antiterminator NusG